MATVTKLEEMRKDLAEIDAKILALIETRVNASKEIQANKKATNLSITDLGQEEKVLNKIIQTTKLNPNQISKIFKNLIDLSKEEFQKKGGSNFD